MRFASFFSGGFITAIIVNPPERRLTKRNSVNWVGLKMASFVDIVGGSENVQNYADVIYGLRHQRIAQRCDLPVFFSGGFITAMPLVTQPMSQLRPNCTELR